jgi:hypothetical protein
MILRDIKEKYGQAFYFVVDKEKEKDYGFIPYLITTGGCDVNIVALKAGAPADFNDDGTDYHILNREVVLIDLTYVQNSDSQT